MNSRLRAQFSEFKLTVEEKGLRVKARVKGNLPIHAIIGYADPEGGGDYNAEIAAAVPLADGSFELLLPHPQNKRKGKVDLHFVAVAANGAATASVWSKYAFTLKAKMSPDGKIDITDTLKKIKTQ